MPNGSVIVDIAIDQGGCVEDIRVTDAEELAYVEEGVVHYCVTNMPGACARSATMALTNATLPYALQLAEQGEAALRNNPGLMNGLNVYKGHVTNQADRKSVG